MNRRAEDAVVKPDLGFAIGSTAFAVAAAFGSAVSVKHDVPGRPFGVSVPLTVPTGLLVGWGAGVAAPWPMPLTALLAAASTRRDEPSPAAAITGLGLGLACIAGTLIEPVTYRRGTPPAVRAAICGNVAASVLLAAAGRRALRRALSAVD